MQSIVKAAALTALVTLACSSPAQQLKGKKVYYINAYHTGYAWSDGEEQSVIKGLEPLGVEVKIARMDTYNDKTPEHLAKVSAECQATIDEWKPDVVVVSDDAPMKAVYKPFYKDKDVPFVFCGVNWTAEAYGVPNKNVTGMLEICPVQDLVAEMRKITPGKTIGFLAADAFTPRKDGENSSKVLGVELQCIYAKTFAEWKQGLLDLQSKVDLLIIGPNMGITGWDEAAARTFAEANTKIVTGAFHDFLNNLALVSFNKLASEQGEWAAQAAVQIMKGTSAGTIPVASNQKGELVINARIAKKSGISPAFELLQSAKVLE